MPPRYPTYLPHPQDIVLPTRHGNHGGLILPERHVRRFRLSELVRHVRNVRLRNLNPRWQTFKLYFFHASAREGPGVSRAGPRAPRPSPWLRGGSAGPLARVPGRGRYPPCLCDKPHMVRPARGVVSEARGW